MLIVESPAKAKTIKKYLGKDFEVMASYGHVRDLVPKEGAVDPSRRFAMRWEVIDKNRKHVDAIARAVKKAEALYLSTDPDRLLLHLTVTVEGNPLSSSGSSAPISSARRRASSIRVSTICDSGTVLMTWPLTKI